MYNPIVNMLRERQELASHDDDHHSPWRRREPGDVDVRRQDIRQFDGADYIPTHTYGLHPGKDRKTPTDHLAPRRPLAGVPVLGAVADFMGNFGERVVHSMPWAKRSEIADGKSHAYTRRGPGRHSNRG